MDRSHVSYFLITAIKHEEQTNAAYYATEDAIEIVNSFYYNLTRRDYKHLLHYYTFTQLIISTL
jgi:hypothetical protein